MVHHVKFQGPCENDTKIGALIHKLICDCGAADSTAENVGAVAREESRDVEESRVVEESRDVKESRVVEERLNVGLDSKGISEISPTWLLENYDGESSLQLAVGLGGVVYDVSTRPELYGIGGGYHLFAGRTITRSLTMMSLDKKDVGRSDIDGFSDIHYVTLRDWILKYDRTYPVIGRTNERWPDFKLVDDGRISNSNVRSRLIAWLSARVGMPEKFSTAATPLGEKPGLPVEEERLRALLSGGSEKLATSGINGKPPGGISSNGRVWTCLSATAPTAYQVDNFLSVEECDVLVKMMLSRHEGRQFSTKLRVSMDPIELRKNGSNFWNASQQFLLESIENRIAHIFDCPPHQDENPMMGMLTMPDSQAPSLHIGVHLDVNRRARRFATCIIYLSDVEEGGETVFVPRTGASDGLIRNGILHTDMISEGSSLRLAQEATTSEENHLASEQENRLKMPKLCSEKFLQENGEEFRQWKQDVLKGDNGIKVRPRKGRALFFWTRKADVNLCYASMHGGNSVGKGMKFTLQKFKEIPFTTAAKTGTLLDTSVVQKSLAKVERIFDQESS